MGWAGPSFTGRVVPSSTSAAMWMAAPAMVVASTMDWSGVELLVGEELLFLVGKGAPSCKEQTSS